MFLTSAFLQPNLFAHPKPGRVMRADLDIGCSANWTACGCSLLRCDSIPTFFAGLEIDLIQFRRTGHAPRNTWRQVGMRTDGAGGAIAWALSRLRERAGTVLAFALAFRALDVILL